MLLGAVHKRRPQSGGFALCGYFAYKGERGYSDANVCTFSYKLIGFFEIYGVSC